MSVVLMSVHPAHTFNLVLCEQLAPIFARSERAGKDTQRVTFASVDLFELMLWASPILPYLQQGLAACGAPSMFGVLPGYWLFEAGQVLAWESGLPDLNDVSVMAPSALVGALWSALTHNPALLGQALLFASEELAARRIVAQFTRARVERRQGQQYRSARTPPPSVDELIRAYRTLGVPPSASDREVNAAWRKRRAEVHPDRAAQDPVEFERRSRVSVGLNQARDLILRQRGRTSARPAA